MRLDIELVNRDIFGSRQKAKEAIRIAYSHAQLDAQDKLAGDTRIIVTLENGISLQLTTNGTQLIGCGAWNCPEFFKFLDENGRK